jgi:hypothetical protein
MVTMRILLGCFGVGLAAAVSAQTLADAGICDPESLKVAEEGLPAIRVFPCQDTLALLQVAELPPANGNALVFGDTDQDGRNEVILEWRDDNFALSYQILEEQGGNVYLQVYQGPPLLPAASGDLDQDGLTEILGQSGFDIQIYESPSLSSHPSQLVWSFTTPTNLFGLALVGDTDGDGRLEFVFNDPYAGFTVYENIGDNAFEQVFFQAGDIGIEFAADLDRDGARELVGSGRYGAIGIFECSGNDSWTEVWSDSTELVNVNASQGGRDTDGNSLPELFVMGNGPGPLGTSWTTYVYETTGDNQFARVDTIQAFDAYTGASSNALGELDGVFPEEYIMQGGQVAWIFRPKRTGQWEFVQQIDDPVFGLLHGLYIHDVNQNDRGELFWTTSANARSIVFEHSPPPPTSSEVMPPGSSYGHLDIVPNPCRRAATLLLPGMEEDASTLAVYDVAGRLVERKAVTRGPRGHVVWQAASRSAGIYFLRLENRAGATIACGRSMVLK